MNTPEKKSKIHLVVNKEFSHEALDCLQDVGVTDLLAETGRSVQLAERRGLSRLLFRTVPIDEEPIQEFSFLVDPGTERELINHLGTALSLDSPGRGSLYAREVTLHRASPSYKDNQCKIPEAGSKVLSTGLMGINCTVQLGEGNRLGQIGLMTGTAVPSIGLGVGTGLRNRLGAWRILVPAEKEVATLIMDASEAETVIDLMIDAGQLDQPGKGYVFMYPVAMGILNTRFNISHSSHAASLEQIISAIDEIKGATDWRKKDLSRAGGLKRRTYLTDLVDYAVICNEGMGEPLTRIAMEAGAGGATIKKLRYISLEGRESSLSPAREISMMTIGLSQIQAITDSLVAEGLLEPEASAEVHLSPVAKAFTYTGK